MTEGEIVQKGFAFFVSVYIEKEWQPDGLCRMQVEDIGRQKRIAFLTKVSTPQKG